MKKLSSLKEAGVVHSSTEIHTRKEKLKSAQIEMNAAAAAGSAAHSEEPTTASVSSPSRIIPTSAAEGGGGHLMP